MEGSRQKFELWQPMLIAFVLGLGMIIGTQLDDELPIGPLAQTNEKSEDWDELLRAINFIRSRYGDSIAIDSISDGAIQYMVDQLDPHSYYLSGGDYAYFKERIAGNYDGIGIEYETFEDTVYLTWVFAEGPAAEVGLKQGDQILAINNQMVSGQGLTKEQIWEVWKDTKRSFSMVLQPVNSTASREVQLTKGVIEFPSVPVATQLGGTIGYIKITRFASGTYTQFMKGLERLADQGIKNLIIDVRNNPGGSLQEVVKILDQLINEKDALLLYTMGEKTKKQEYRSTGRVFHRMNDLVILVNEHSVSASEVLAGVLQDLGRAKIVGRRTFGKALVQEMYDLSDEAALNLSIGKYYLPSGRYIQRSYKDKSAYKTDLKKRIRNGELFVDHVLSIDSNHMQESSDGVIRPVGEGVVPDVFVGIDSLQYSDYWKHRKRDFNRTTFSWLRKSQVDSNNVGQMLNQDSLLYHEVVASYVPDSRVGTSTEDHWKDFLIRQSKFNMLWYVNRERAMIEYGQHLDWDLQTALRLLRKSDLGSKKDQL